MCKTSHFAIAVVIIMELATCWEIFSLGKIPVPYPGVDYAKVISFLKSGKILEQPQLCPSKMYVKRL